MLKPDECEWYSLVKGKCEYFVGKHRKKKCEAVCVHCGKPMHKEGWKWVIDETSQ